MVFPITTRSPRIIISGGGTGGHIFPAISIANQIKQQYPDAEILFVGALGRMEMERVPKAGFKIVGLPVMGLDRKRLWRNFKVILKLYESIRQARKIIRDFKPDVAIGVGGYASGPILKAAQKAGIPTVLQEQNSYAGVTNKMLARKANLICVAYEGLERFFPADKIVLTGNPVRNSILECDTSKADAKKALGFDPSRPLVFVCGGSLGSRSINEAVKASLPVFTDNNISLLWQTGRSYAESCTRAAEGLENVRASAFIENMALAYRAADIVVARGGASTISELQLLGLPAILVPSPNVAEDHQRKNAMALVNREAAVMIADNEVHGSLASTVTNLINDSARLERMSLNISQMALRDAARHIVEKIFVGKS